MAGSPRRTPGTPCNRRPRRRPPTPPCSGAAQASASATGAVVSGSPAREHRTLDRVPGPLSSHPENHRLPQVGSECQDGVYALSPQNVSWSSPQTEYSSPERADPATSPFALLGASRWTWRATPVPSSVWRLIWLNQTRRSVSALRAQLDTASSRDLQAIDPAVGVPRPLCRHSPRACRPRAALAAGSHRGGGLYLPDTSLSPANGSTGDQG